ncbi:MAG TPA: lipid-binding SYLF domain-containing protein [Gemmataceae bacterium]|nr:lipid-binding SYLF domain-containing protein [Gemmataceae bacterium]
MRFAGAIVLVVGLWVGAVSPALAQSPLDETVNGATQVLREIMAVPNKCVPESLLREAQGVAIVPGMVKGGFIVGVQRGRGVLTTRDETGLWRAPVFITVTGGSVGAQAGVQAIDLILVFKTKRSVQGILKGKLTIGADLAVAAGPVGRQALAATDAQLKAEILSYSRSRGLFAGVAIDGATMHIDHGANAEYYALRPGQPAGSIPASGVVLAQLVSTYAPPPPRQAPVVVLTPREAAPPPTFAPPDEREAVRQQLVAVAQRLQSSLDPAWQQYLALPAEVITGQPLPPAATLEPVVRRYQTVASEARYHELSEHPEFQETYALLRRYASLAQPRPAGTLPLPPPPGH